MSGAHVAQSLWNFRIKWPRSPRKSKMFVIKATTKRYLGQERGWTNSADHRSLALLSPEWTPNLKINRSPLGNKILKHSKDLSKTQCKTLMTFSGQFSEVVPVKTRRDPQTFLTSLVYREFSRILDNNSLVIVRAAVVRVHTTTPSIPFSVGRVNFSVKTHPLRLTWMRTFLRTISLKISAPIVVVLMTCLTFLDECSRRCKNLKENLHQKLPWSAYLWLKSRSATARSKKTGN